MTVLAIETATRCVGCALWDEGAPLASFTLVAGPRHAEVLMPAIDELCRRAGLSAADIEAVAVDVGPGLFTGLRVGLATARTIAIARGLPAVGVTSLEALAHPHRRRPGLVAAVVDARRGEVYWALYRSDGTDMQELRPPSLATPEQLASELAGLSPAPLAVGDGAWRYREPIESAGARSGGPLDLWPSPTVIAELGTARLAGVGPVSPLPDGAQAVAHPWFESLPLPLYLRQADVRIGWEQVGGRVGLAKAPAPKSGVASSRSGP
jgi:tRNA threonylcarbamoyladenosine biosynthesis protein TsaB